MSEETGLPAEYMVAYKKEVYNCEHVEALVHKRLQRYRITNKRFDRSREFFRLPLHKAIEAILEITEDDTI
jgi:hypothetical protein